MRHVAMALALASAVWLATGCGRKAPPAARVEPPPPVVAEVPPPPPPAPSEPSPAPSALSEDDLFARKTLAELNAERPLGDAYFDYDQWHLRDDARTVLQRNAEWLRRWKTTRITVEGHCDERGTPEYNLALGERRAHAVKEYLVGIGIEPDRILVVSKGKESPSCFEAHEGCWQRNRRGHPNITAK